MKRIVIVDDHLMVGQSISSLLQAADEGIEAETLGSMDELFAALDDGQNYDLILLDHDMPDMKGVDGLMIIKDKYPDQIVGMMSGITSPKIIDAAMTNGSIGWIPKSMSGRPLIHAILVMVEGGKFIPGDIIDQLRAEYNKFSVFSDVEKQIIKGLLEGSTDKEIGSDLDIPYRTVQHHTRIILKKSNCENRTKFALAFRD